MTLSLYNAIVPGFIRTVDASIVCLKKAEAHYASTGQDINAVMSERLVEDMLPMSVQIMFLRHHTITAIKGLQAGRSTPSSSPSGDTFDAAIDDLKTTSEALAKVLPHEVDDYADKSVIFEVGEIKIPFTGTGFLMSFSLPNLHFHATTMYDILRIKGVPLSKRDYLGAMDIAVP